MIIRAYTVYDNKALTYSPPFFVSTDAAAVRMVQDLVDDTGTQVGRHPKDFSLFFVGEFDADSARLLAQQPLVHVVDAVALVRVVPLPLMGQAAQ